MAEIAAQPRAVRCSQHVPKQSDCSRLLAWCLAAACGLSCNSHEIPEPARDELHLPTGMLVSPDANWLFVVSSDLDRSRSHSTLSAVDLRALDGALADVAGPGAEPSEARPCRQTTDGASSPVECDPRFLLAADATVLLPRGAGNIAVDYPAGPGGPMRFLIPSTIDVAVSWIDVFAGNSLRMDCGQDSSGVCDADHTLERLGNNPNGSRLPADPARISVDTQGFRFAYVPHLFGGNISLIDLDGAYGPEITDIEDEFFLPDPLTETEYAGGFAVAQLPCDPENPPDRLAACDNPYLFATQRHWPAFRMFTVATGLGLILGRGNVALLGPNFRVVEDRPYTGDAALEDPAVGDRMLAVHTTPPSLTRVDVSVADNRIANEVIETIGLCNYPNILEVYRPEGEQPLAFVTCFGDNELAVVDLGAFAVIREVPLGDGPNDMAADLQRRKLYVANVQDSTISVVELDRTSPRFLQVVAQLGLSPGAS